MTNKLESARQAAENSEDLHCPACTDLTQVEKDTRKSYAEDIEMVKVLWVPTWEAAELLLANPNIKTYVDSYENTDTSTQLSAQPEDRKLTILQSKAMISSCPKVMWLVDFFKLDWQSIFQNVCFQYTVQKYTVQRWLICCTTFFSSCFCCENSKDSLCCFLLSWSVFPFYFGQGASA